MRKLIAVFLACTLLLCGAASAENNDAIDRAQPLIDLTVAAAMMADETPENISGDGMLSANFIYNFFLLGQDKTDTLGITPAYLSDTEAQAAYLQRVFTVALPETLDGILSLGGSFEYIGVRVSAADFDAEGKNVRLVGDVYRADAPIMSLTEQQTAAIRWLDHRAVIEMTASDASPCGWKIVSLSFDDELNVESLTETYFNETMMEYIAGDYGFSIQYPAVFKEDMLKEENGCLSAALPDGSASFFVKRTENAGHQTLDSLIENAKQENPDAETNINDISACARIVTHRDDGSTAVDMYIVSDAWIYQAELIYSADKAKEFSLYSDYMMNSFNADEVGIG